MSGSPLLNGTYDNDLVFDNAAVEHQLSVERGDMLSLDISRVLLIYTGGTIGMKNTPAHGYIPVPNYFAQSLAKVQRFHDPGSPQSTSQHSRSSSVDSSDGSFSPQYGFSFGKFTNTVRMIEQSGPNKGQETILQLPSLITPVSLYGKRIKYSILEYDPLLDSSNMTAYDWARIAGDIEANYRYYDAFIVLHGTDTMAYTASALSFMLEDLGKTVIITGSQVPLTEVRNDAVENLLGALTIAGHFMIPEVCLYFNQKLYRGNRTSKISAVDFEAFDSPNMPPLVTVGIDIDVNWPLIYRPTQIARFRAQKTLSQSVASLRLFPGISPATMKAFLAPPIRGVILETYGAGNAPTREELLEVLKEACDRGVVVVNCTQCRKGLVTDTYATGKQLARVGVIPGADMTPECALTKLSYILGKIPDNPEQVRAMMTKNLCGELTVRAPMQRFSVPTNRSTIMLKTIMKFCYPNLTQQLDKDGYTDMPDTVQSIDEDIQAEKALGPVLLCSAAAANDVEGIESLFQTMGEILNLNHMDYDGRVPLHVACRDGHLRVVETLLRHGASIYMRDRYGHTPLFDAVVYERADIVQLLVDTGAHWAENEVKDFGPVWLTSIRQGNIKKVKLALDAGWEVNWAEPVEGRRALDVAVCEGRVSCLRVLLGHADIELEYRDRWGFSLDDKVVMLEQSLQKSVQWNPKRLMTLDQLEQMKLLLDSKKHLREK